MPPRRGARVCDDGGPVQRTRGHGARWGCRSGTRAKIPRTRDVVAVVGRPLRDPPNGARLFFSVFLTPPPPSRDVRRDLAKRSRDGPGTPAVRTIDARARRPCPRRRERLTAAGAGRAPPPVGSQTRTGDRMPAPARAPRRAAVFGSKGGARRRSIRAGRFFTARGRGRNTTAMRCLRRRRRRRRRFYDDRTGYADVVETDRT